MNAGALESGTDRLTAAVDDNGVQADDLQQDDVAHHLRAQLGIDHRRPAVLDNDRLAGRALDPRKGLGQNLGRLVGFRFYSRISSKFHDR